MLLGLVLVLAPVLDSARIEVELVPGGASVIAAYHSSSRDSLRLVLIRLPGQTVDGIVTTGRTEPTDGLTRIVAAPEKDGLVVVHYRVTGGADRIPIPVPSISAARGALAVEIRLTGLAPDLRLDDAFPRLARTGAEARATLSAVPSVVRLPGSSWSVLRALDLLVVALVAGASLLWLLRFRPRPAR